MLMVRENQCTCLVGRIRENQCTYLVGRIRENQCTYLIGRIRENQCTYLVGRTVFEYTLHNNTIKAQGINSIGRSYLLVLGKTHHWYYYYTNL